MRRLLYAAGLVVAIPLVPFVPLLAISLPILLVSAGVVLFVDAFAGWELPPREDAVRWALAAVADRRDPRCGSATNAVVHNVFTRPFDATDGGVFDTGPYPQGSDAPHVHEIIVDADTRCGTVRFQYIVYESVVILGLPLRQTRLRECNYCPVMPRPPKLLRWEPLQNDIW